MLSENIVFFSSFFMSLGFANTITKLAEASIVNNWHGNKHFHRSFRSKTQNVLALIPPLNKRHY